MILDDDFKAFKLFFVAKLNSLVGFCEYSLSSYEGIRKPFGDFI